MEFEVEGERQADHIKARADVGGGTGRSDNGGGWHGCRKQGIYRKQTLTITQLKREPSTECVSCSILNHLAWSLLFFCSVTKKSPRETGGRWGHWRPARTGLAHSWHPTLNQNGGNSDEIRQDTCCLFSASSRLCTAT